MYKLNSDLNTQITTISQKIQHSISGSLIGYYASRTFETDELTNVSQGQIIVSITNGVTMIYFVNVKCTPKTKIVNIAGYLGGVRKYYYDSNNTGIYIDDSWIYCNVAEPGYRILTIVMV